MDEIICGGADPYQGMVAHFAAQVRGRVESALGDPGSSIDERLTKLFDAFSQLAESPTSAVARQEVLMQGQSITDTSMQTWNATGRIGFEF